MFEEKSGKTERPEVGETLITFFRTLLTFPTFPTY